MAIDHVTVSDYSGVVERVTNDYMATGALIEATQLGLLIPRDLSIFGFNDTDMSAHLDPPLTAICMPSHLMGVEIATYIIDYLEQNTAKAPPLINSGRRAPPSAHDGM